MRLGAEGVAVISVGDVTAQLRRMKKAGIVSVVVNPKTPTPLPSVGIDEEGGGHLAGNHLIDQGCRRIAFAQPPTKVVKLLPDIIVRKSSLRI